MCKNKFFRIGERVFYNQPEDSNDSDLRGFATILLIDNKEEDGVIDEDSIVLLQNENSEFEGYGDYIEKM
jgi:hypothetical protein